MSIRGIPLSPVSLSMDSSTSVKDALKTMIDKEINHIPLCDNQAFKGIIGIKDILLEVMPVSARMEDGLTDLAFAGDAMRLLTSRLQELGARKAIEIADGSVPVLDEDFPILEAALLLARNNAPLPVVDAQHRLIGMLSRRALLRHIHQQAGM